MAAAPRPHDRPPRSPDGSGPAQRPLRSVPPADPGPAEATGRGAGDPATGGSEARSATSAAHAEDLALCRRILAGERAAGDTFVAQHLDGVYRFLLYRVGRDVALAEDLAQDTLVTGIERLATYDGRAGLHAWLCGIAKNHLRDGVRKRRPTSIEDLLATSDGEIDALLARIEHEPLPDEVLERAETAELVGATLSSLPPSYRAALLDKYVEGRTVPETATLTGRNVKAVESTLHRARRAFSDVFTLLARRRGGFD